MMVITYEEKASMKKYYLHNGTTHLGPFTLEELKLKRISKRDMIWFEGAPGWQEAEEIKDLKPLFIITPPPLEIQDKTQKSEHFPESNLFGITVKGLRNDLKKVFDISTLLLAADENFANIFLIYIAEIYDDPKRKEYINKIRNERANEILIKKKNLPKHLDEIITYLCISNQRFSAEQLYSRISKVSNADSTVKVEEIIRKYNLDMSIEKSSKDRQARYEKRKENEEKAKEEDAKNEGTDKIFGIIFWVTVAGSLYGEYYLKPEEAYRYKDVFHLLNFACLASIIYFVVRQSSRWFK